MSDVYTISHGTGENAHYRRRMTTLLRRGRMRIARGIRRLLEEEAKSMRQFYDYYGPEKRNCLA